MEAVESIVSSSLLALAIALAAVTAPVQVHVYVVDSSSAPDP